MPCINPYFDLAQFDVSVFDTLCPAVDLTPTSITVTSSERNKAIVSFSEENKSTVTSSE